MIVQHLLKSNWKDIWKHIAKKLNKCYQAIWWQKTSRNSVSTLQHVKNLTATIALQQLHCNNCTTSIALPQLHCSLHIYRTFKGQTKATKTSWSAPTSPDVAFAILWNPNVTFWLTFVMNLFYFYFYYIQISSTLLSFTFNSTPEWNVIKFGVCWKERTGLPHVFDWNSKKPMCSNLHL